MKCMKTKQIFTSVFLMLKRCCVLISALRNNAGSRQFASHMLKNIAKQLFLFYIRALKIGTFCYPEPVIKMFSQ